MGGIAKGDGTAIRPLESTDRIGVPVQPYIEGECHLSGTDGKVDAEGLNDTEHFADLGPFLAVFQF